VEGDISEYMFRFIARQRQNETSVIIRVKYAAETTFSRAVLHWFIDRTHT